MACLRDSDHVVLAMSTAGTFNPTGKYVPRGPSQDFNRPQLFYDYYVSQHSIDDNNNVRQGTRGIEEVWSTKTWMHMVFALVMGVSEANAWLAYRAFADPQEYKTHSEFRKALALELFQQEKYEDSTPRSKRRKEMTESPSHLLRAFPPYRS